MIELTITSSKLMTHTQIVLDRVFDFDRMLEIHTEGITGVNHEETDAVDNDPLGLRDIEPWFGDDSDDQ